MVRRKSASRPRTVVASSMAMLRQRFCTTPQARRASQYRTYLVSGLGLGSGLFYCTFLVMLRSMRCPVRYPFERVTEVSPLVSLVPHRGWGVLAPKAARTHGRPLLARKGTHEPVPGVFVYTARDTSRTEMNRDVYTHTHPVLARKAIMRPRKEPVSTCACPRAKGRKGQSWYTTAVHTHTAQHATRRGAMR